MWYSQSTRLLARKKWRLLLVRSDSSLLGWFARPTTLHSYLIRLIIGALGPLLIFSILMMVLFARQEQATRRRGLEDTARALTLAIDQEVESSITNLEALATSEPLDFGRVKIFRTIAALLRSQIAGRSITLSDHTASQWLRSASRSRQGSASISPRSPGQNTAHAAPGDRLIFPDSVLPKRGSAFTSGGREQTIIYVLTAAIEPRAFSDILAQQKLPNEWLGTLFDAQQIIVARSRDAEKYVGKPVGPLLGKTDLQATEQFFEGVTRGGAQAYAAINRSRQSGWFVALTVPGAEVTPSCIGSLAMLGGGRVALAAQRLVRRGDFRAPSLPVDRRFIRGGAQFRGGPVGPDFGAFPYCGAGWVSPRDGTGGRTSARAWQ